MYEYEYKFRAEADSAQWYWKDLDISPANSQEHTFTNLTGLTSQQRGTIIYWGNRTHQLTARNKHLLILQDSPANSQEHTFTYLTGLTS